MSTRPATLIGFGAVVLWALLALFTASSGAVPPFQLAALSFGIGGTAGAISWLWRPQAAAAMRQSIPVWALGVGGLFGYHFLYFSALRAAPPVEASLIAYLWPLLIVLFSALLPGAGLRVHHVIGALVGFAGAALIVTGGRGLTLDPAFAYGYGLALAAAVVWAGYSVLSRRVAQVPTDAVTGFCLATSALATVAHLALETTVWPDSSAQWLAILGLGLGPVGLAFYLWDVGVKKGDIQVLGAASYAAPLLSTIVLVIAGQAAPSSSVAIACALITLGAVIAAKDMILRRG
ncbi:MAG: EamA family transporter [Pseudomonadota bacterium]